MAEPVSTTPANDVIRIEGNSLTLKVGEYKLTLKIEGPEAKPSGRLQLGTGTNPIRPGTRCRQDIYRRNRKA